MSNQIKCDFCGAIKEGPVSFVIGAKSSNPELSQEWCMVYGTGKMACYKCYPEAAKQADEKINNHVAQHNAKFKKV